MSPTNVGRGKLDNHDNTRLRPPGNTARTAAALPPPDNTVPPNATFGCTPALSDTNVVSIGAQP